eukprot:6211939-Pleurochrysis_carterae.AAC.3
MSGSIRWQFQCPGVSKMAIRIICSPQLTDREQRIAHGRYTAYVCQSELNDTVLRVAGRERQVPHRDARTRLPIYTRNSFGARSNVYQILQVRVDVISTTAVNYKSNVSALLAQVPSVTVAEACSASGYESARARGNT